MLKLLNGCRKLQRLLKTSDKLAPYISGLLKHVDELVIFAEANEKYLDKELLPYVDFCLPRLDYIAPQLPFLKSHVPLLLKKNLVWKIARHLDNFVRKKSYETKLGNYASANLDVLIFWLGWMFKVPGLPSLIVMLPFSPRLLAFLAKRLPKKFVRGPSNKVIQG